MQTPVPSPQSRRPSRRPLLIGAVAAAILVIAVFATVTLVGSPESAQPKAGESTASPQQGPSGDVFGSAGGLSCIEQYSPQTLAKRGFAFAGTVTSIGQPASGEENDGYVPVAFTVSTWFRGGQGPTVTVWMLAPDAVTSAGKAPYQVGARLLVSGERRGAGARPDDLVAWACGFTRWNTVADAIAWEKAFR